MKEPGCGRPYGTYVIFFITYVGLRYAYVILCLHYAVRWRTFTSAHEENKTHTCNPSLTVSS